MPLCIFAVYFCFYWVLCLFMHDCLCDCSAGVKLSWHNMIYEGKINKTLLILSCWHLLVACSFIVKDWFKKKKRVGERAASEEKLWGPLPWLNSMWQTLRCYLRWEKSFQKPQRWSNDDSIQMFFQSADESRCVGWQMPHKCLNNLENNQEKRAVQNVLWQNITRGLCMWC